jgi:DNA modification methylase
MMLKTVLETKNEVDLLTNSEDKVLLNKIERLDNELINYFSKIFVVDNALTRKLVSFQANKTRPYYRWYKYKEAFSANLVNYFFTKYSVKKGMILDPFAGAGTALFACCDLGYPAEGIELLPVGQKIIIANNIARTANKKKLVRALDYWVTERPWNNPGKIKEFEILRITNGAYPEDTHYKIRRYLYDIEKEEHEIKEILLFALLCILESVSYTRKDGQYLRWDYRSGRINGKSKFDKGRIIPFDEAMLKKLREIRDDIKNVNIQKDMFSFIQKKRNANTSVKLLQGSCLNILPGLKSRYYTGIITSPPYCNRYDYTRTYALEHALLGINESQLTSLRQAMLTCTVENKAKELTKINKEWRHAINICDNLPLLQSISTYLDIKKSQKQLNNNGIVRMVRGYFYEMACVIQECYRVLDDSGIMFMVNDNVRYAGVSISVDTILSKIAEEIGFKIKNILVLPHGKGNSSQQMGKHGRAVLRKCVYVWIKER